MQIQEIYIENFRGIKKMNLMFNGKNAVIIGSNGVGKSSILQAITILLSRVVESLSYGSSKRISIDETDIANGKQRLILKAKIQSNNINGDMEIIKPRARNARQKVKTEYNNNTVGIVNDIQSKMDNFGGSIPVVVYYPVNRSVVTIPLRVHNKHIFDQISAYENCLSSGTEFRMFFEWYRNQEDLENEERLTKSIDYEDSQLKAVRKAIYAFLPGFSDLRIMRKEKMRMVISKANKRLEINQLSDGEKCMLAMIGDLARRLALANPTSSNPLDGKGVVLIDEVDLHLHPAWQREFVKRLEKTFPNIQFLLTTHSPQVLGELSNSNVFILSVKNNDDELYLKVVPSLFGKDSNLILEQYMEASEQNKEVKSRVSELFKLVMDGNIVDAHELFNDLKSTLGSHDPQMVKAELLIKRKESLQK